MASSPSDTPQTETTPAPIISKTSPNTSETPPPLFSPDTQMPQLIIIVKTSAVNHSLIETTAIDTASVNKIVVKTQTVLPTTTTATDASIFQLVPSQPTSESTEDPKFSKMTCMAIKKAMTALGGPRTVSTNLITRPVAPKLAPAIVKPSESMLLSVTPMSLPAAKIAIPTVRGKSKIILPASSNAVKPMEESTTKRKGCTVTKISTASKTMLPAGKVAIPPVLGQSKIIAPSCSNAAKPTVVESGTNLTGCTVATMPTANTAMPALANYKKVIYTCGDCTQKLQGLQSLGPLSYILPKPPVTAMNAYGSPPLSINATVNIHQSFPSLPVPIGAQPEKNMMADKKTSSITSASGNASKVRISCSVCFREFEYVQCPQLAYIEPVSTLNQSSITSTQSLENNKSKAALSAKDDSKVQPQRVRLRNLGYQCPFCPKKFKWYTSFYKHKKDLHPEHRPRRPTPEEITCHRCLEVFPSGNQLKLHIHSKHSRASGEVQNLTFATLNDFLEWKEKMESETSSRFRRRNSRPYVTKTGNVTYYFCHRSGKYRPNGQNSKRSKSFDSAKIGHRCDSLIKCAEVTEGDKKEVRVRFYPRHTDHGPHPSATWKKKKPLSETKAELLAKFKQVIDTCKNAKEVNSLSELLPVAMQRLSTFRACASVTPSSRVSTQFEHLPSQNYQVSQKRQKREKNHNLDLLLHAMTSV